MKPIPSVTPHLTREIVQTCLIHLPTKVGLFERETATKCLIDSLACAFAAYKEYVRVALEKGKGDSIINFTEWRLKNTPKSTKQSK